MATTPRTAVPDYLGLPQLPLEQVEDLLKLQKAAHKISSILDLDELLDQIVNDVAHSFGCLEANVYLHDEERSEMVLAGMHGCTKACKGERLTLKIGKQGMVGYVAATGQMRYAPDVSQDPYYVVCEPSTRSELAIPLLSGGKLVGVFTASHPEMDAFPPEQLRLLQALCSHISVAVNNARIIRREREEREAITREAQEARAIQQALLPKKAPAIPGFSISGLCIPVSAVGGDWYDFIPLEDGRWGLVLADVSGKGTAAALLMSATRGMLRSLAETCCSPAEVLTRLNRLMVEDFPSGRFVTMIYAILDPLKRTLTFASAGHLQPLLVDENGSRFLESDRGLPLGLGFSNFSEQQVQLPPNSRVALYSDGITEASNPAGEEYGPRRLLDHVLLPNASAENILEDVRAFANGANLQDDSTVIFIRAEG